MQNIYALAMLHTTKFIGEVRKIYTSGLAQNLYEQVKKVRLYARRNHVTVGALYEKELGCGRAEV